MREVPKNFVKDSTGKKMAKLGNGGCMTVYRMKNAEGKFFAVKTVEESEETRAHVEREAFTLERMKHRHVIRYYRIHENDDEGEVGIVMEWAQGGSLADLIKARKKRSQKVDTSELLEINIQMATALDYVHGEGILHRDVLILPSPRAKQQEGEQRGTTRQKKQGRKLTVARPTCGTLAA